jgi:propane monooxygenase reductase subunit
MLWTDDIRSLRLSAEPGFEFKPGQYVDISIPGDGDHHRSFSMANTTPGELEFMIKLYPGGRFSGLLGGTGSGPGRRCPAGSPAVGSGYACAAGEADEVHEPLGRTGSRRTAAHRR